MPKFSIITPTNDPQHLSDLWRSIKCQKKIEDWEWVILANGGITGADLEGDDDNRIRIHQHDGDNSYVGFLKKMAFEAAKGEILVEVDHDDILMSDCLLKLQRAFDEHPECGFVYSNNIKLSNNFKPYNPAYGWEHRKVKYSRGKYYEMRSFKADAGAMAYIWHCPDHVRAWRADVYHEVGGHNPDMAVCDDHELLIRTYMKTKFHHIDEPLYVYRITGDNTWLQRNKDIQSTTRELCREWLPRLAERDAEVASLEKVDLGGGINPKEGYLVIDKEGTDFSWDLNNGIPLKNNSVGVINASHILEHVQDKHWIMSEIHRVLCDGGWAFIEVPSTDGRGAFMDPTHVSYWNENSFMYYTKADQAKFIRNDKIKFQQFWLETFYPGEWWKENNIPVVASWLRAVKSDKRRPYLLEI